MYSLKNRIKTCLKVMEAGKAIELKSGHKLVIADGDEEPGFLVTQSQRGAPDEEVVFQIGSDTAWMGLIQYAKDMTKQEHLELMFSIADVKLPGRYDRP